MNFHRVMDTSTDSIFIQGTSVVVYGTVLDIGENTFSSHGHCWATHNNPTITDFHSDLGPIYGSVEFWSHLNSIRPGIIHYVRSYLFDGKNYTYGDEISFEISAEDIEFYSNPAKKLDASTIEVSSSTIGVGFVNFSNHGHCWSQTDPPTVQDNKTELGPYLSDANFTSQINDVNRGRYYIRGYLESEGV